MDEVTFIIKWEVTWYLPNSETEKVAYAETEETFSIEEDEVEYYTDFMDNYDELIGDDRFTPEMNVQEYIDDGFGDVNIEYVAISDVDGNLLWSED